MSTYAPEVLADPLGVVVDLIEGREPGLDRVVIADVVDAVAGGRAKQRRLAQALLDKPGVLVAGRSPAPQVVGNLLLALREAGAHTISAPVCAGCGRPLGALIRCGQDWLCATCGSRPKRACSSCGREKQINSIDRHGGPRCKQCPDRDGRDPLTVLTDVVAGLDPSLTAQTVTAAAQRACSTPAGLRRLAWAVEDAPGLLIGEGARAPVPSVLRLIDELCAAGAQVITRPACPRCARVVGLHRRVEGQWLCRNCVATSRAQPCARCGRLREAAARDEHSQPLCSNCWVTDVTNQERCVGCRRRRRVVTRTAEGAWCDTCRPWKIATCAVCGAHGPCAVSQITGKPRCRACKKRWARCSGCGQDRPLRSGSLDRPLCSSCTGSSRTGASTELWRSCPGCGDSGRVTVGPCARCRVGQRLRELFGDDTGHVRAELHDLYQSLAYTDRPVTVKNWLDTSAGAALLSGLGAGGPLTHEGLDQLPAGNAVEHVRAILVNTGTLPARDEQLIRLERFLTRAISERADPDEQHLLHRYAVWHLLRRLRRRVGGAETTYEQASVVRAHVKGAVTLLDWLSARGRTLASARQGDIEAWRVSNDASYRREGGAFLRWANRQKLTSGEVAASRWDGPAQALDTEARWQRARRLLHPDPISEASLTTEDRVAGLLVVLYAQWPATISRLCLDDFELTEDTVRIRFGPEPVVLPEPLADLVRGLATRRRGHAALGDPGTSRWLFPGGQPGRPISAHQLRQRLHRLGLRPSHDRSAAQFQLATDLPAALLARMLGVHISVAVAWQRASAGDWTSYAAQLGHRPLPREDR